MQPDGCASTKPALSDRPQLTLAGSWTAVHHAAQHWRARDAPGDHETLHALAQAGVSRSQRDGRERIWPVQTKRLHQVRAFLAQISAQCDEALQRLRAAVETET